MKSTEELYDLVPKLIEAVEKDGKKLKFTDKAKSIIKEIAAYALGTKIWERTAEYREQFWKDNAEATPEQVYYYMLDRIVNAPTMFHRESSVLLIIPRLYELLKCETDGRQT